MYGVADNRTPSRVGRARPLRRRGEGREMRGGTERIGNLPHTVARGSVGAVRGPAPTLREG